MPGKRSDPKQLAKEREMIAREREEVDKYGKTQPNLFEKVTGAWKQARERRRLSKNPPPVRKGAHVVGFGPGKTTI